MYGVNKLKKVCKILIMSAIICFSLTFTLMIINAVMGIFIRLNFYLLLFGILTTGFTVALTLFDSKNIFYSKKVKKPVKSKTVRKAKTKKVEHQTKVRRKIS